LNRKAVQIKIYKENNCDLLFLNYDCSGKNGTIEINSEEVSAPEIRKKADKCISAFI